VNGCAKEAENGKHAALGTKQSQRAGSQLHPLHSSANLCFHLISIRFLEKNHS
jgi:hypothetical protein